MARSEWRKIIILMLTISLWTYWFPYYVILKDFLYDTKVSDFHTFYMAGKSWLSGMNPYVNLQAHIPFFYPPTSLPFFSMFAPLDFALAAQLWTVMYIAMFLVPLLALALIVKGERRSLILFFAVLLFLNSYPMLFMMQLSQGIDFIIAGLTVLSLVMERVKHQFSSAVLLSMGTLLKGPAIFLLIYFVIFRRDLRYLANFLVSTLVIVGTSLLVVPIKLYWFYAVNIVPTLFSEYSLVDSQSIVRLFYLAGLGEPVLQAISVAGFGLFALFAFYVNSNRWASVRGKRTLRADAMFLMNGLVILFLSPRSLIYPYVWVILPVALFLSALIVEDVKLAYLAVIGFALCFLNSSSGIYFVSLFIYPMTLPTFLIGNLILTISLIPVIIHPSAICRNVKSQLMHRKRF